MRTTFNFLLISIFCISIFPQQLNAQLSCATATNLTVSASCTTTNDDLASATSATPVPTCGGATAYGMWYTFTATSAKATITVNGLGTNLTTTTTYVQVLSGSCSSFSSIACQNVATPLAMTTLTVGTTYYVRVFITTVPGGPANKNKFSICIQSSPNDECNSASSLISNLTCTNTSGTLDLTTATTGLAAGCETAGTHYDVWYNFVAASTTHTVTLNSLTNISNPEVQLYSGSCGSLVSLQCGTNTLTSTGLTIGSTYYVRVSNIGSVPTSSSFNICVTHPPPPPANDNCNNAIILVSNTTCSNTASTLAGATPSAGIPLGCAAAGTYNEVWFKFDAAATTQTITMSYSSSGSGANITNPAIQLFSGTCGTLTSIACGTTSIPASGLTPGTTYYVRVSNVGASVITSGTFNICVTHPAPVIPSIDYSKSYINISKGSTGGTVNPGDTLEMRVTLAIKSGTVDSLSFTDTLFNTKGLRLVPGSIALRTNEGKIYGNGAAPFTDAFDSDAGWHYQNGLDTIVKINFGTGATNLKRGTLSSTSKPSVFGSTCIIMATYRVVVYAAFNTKINFKTGALSFRNQATSVLNTITFAPNNLIVYQSPGLCPNAVSATNAVGAENNGTFGAALAQNRSASPYTSYVYSLFSNAGGPQDYYYGIANNTSSKYTAQTTWPKPDNGGYRVFSQWDITGDHTNASNTLLGNPPCDNTKPISPSNPCGYMLVVNSAYKADTAFTYNITNLCPNTYYELSAWFKNICYKCGCDSTGAGSGNAGYIPTALGDSSGVRPNIAFDVNGTDYYTTGDILYTGKTPTGSDSTNKWVKRGFVYLTGPSETSFLLTLRNNAPGGGGNDWALDDIAVATCLPDMQYSPSLSPNVCEANAISINDTIRSYFNNYTYYKWQKSADAGSTWSDVTSAQGPSTPVYNGTSWEYITTYTVPPTSTTMANNNDRYRVVVATASSALANTACQFTDGISIINVNVISCGPVLNTSLLSFNGKKNGGFAQLYWTTTNEDNTVQFDLERSDDGLNYFKITSIAGQKNNVNGNTNYYDYKDPLPLSKETTYRLVIRSKDHQQISRSIRFTNENEEFKLMNVLNPFNNNLLFDVLISENSTIEISLMDMYGKKVSVKTTQVFQGINSLGLSNTDALPSGIYILQVKNKLQSISKRIFKK